MIAFLKAIPGMIKLALVVFNLLTSLFVLLKANAEENKKKKIKKDLSASLKAAAQQVKQKKKESIGAIQDALQGNST